MTSTPATVLVVAQPGPLRESLQSFLQMLPQPMDVLLADNAEVAHGAIARSDPLLIVVVDAGLPDPSGALRVMGQARAVGAGSRWLFLTECPERERAAIAAGADAVLPQGYPAPDLFGVVERLLDRAWQREG